MTDTYIAAHSGHSDHVHIRRGSDGTMHRISGKQVGVLGLHPDPANWSQADALRAFDLGEPIVVPRSVEG